MLLCPLKMSTRSASAIAQGGAVENIGSRWSTSWVDASRAASSGSGPLGRCRRTIWRNSRKLCCAVRLGSTLGGTERLCSEGRRCLAAVRRDSAARRLDRPYPPLPHRAIVTRGQLQDPVTVRRIASRSANTAWRIRGDPRVFWRCGRIRTVPGEDRQPTSSRADHRPDGADLSSRARTAAPSSDCHTQPHPAKT
jgi:hypothetical protein